MSGTPSFFLGEGVRWPRSSDARWRADNSHFSRQRPPVDHAALAREEEKAAADDSNRLGERHLENAHGAHRRARGVCVEGGDDVVGRAERERDAEDNAPCNAPDSGWKEDARAEPGTSKLLQAA